MWSLFTRVTSNVTLKISSAPLLRSFSSMQAPQNKLLEPAKVNFMPACGFKVKGVVKKRCKDCFFVFRENRLYNLCKTHPRHKQMSIKADPKKTWILTAASQTKFRPW